MKRQWDNYDVWGESMYSEAFMNILQNWNPVTLFAEPCVLILDRKIKQTCCSV